MYNDVLSKDGIPNNQVDASSYDNTNNIDIFYKWVFAYKQFNYTAL